MSLSNEQKGGLKAAIGGLGIIAIIIGALTDAYDVIIGVVIALGIWIVGIPLLRLLKLHPEKEHQEGRSDEGEPYTQGRKGTSIWTWIVIAVVVCFAAFWIVGYASGRGSGTITSEDRSVSDFSRVEIDGRGNLIITQAEEETLRVETDDNLIDRIKTTVSGDTLTIGIRNPYVIWSFWPTEGPNYYLTVDDLSKITINGSGSVETDALTAETLEMNINGSGDANMTVTVTALDVSVSGSGDTITVSTFPNRSILSNPIVSRRPITLVP